MITTRDLQVIEFLETYKVANTSTIKELFFVSLSVTHKRLKYLYNSKEVSRLRDNANAEYIYYCKKRPLQLQHSLLVTSFYRELHKVATIVNFKIEIPLGDIRPDALVAYTFNNKKCLALLEVELSNKGFDFKKYNNFVSSGLYRDFFPIIPTVFIVSDKVILPTVSNIKYIRISTNFKNFSCI